MSKPWSKLKKDLSKLFDENLDVDIHQSVYRMQSQMGNSDLPRYFVTFNKEIIFDFPKMFINEKLESGFGKGYTVKNLYPYDGTVSELSQIIREYINTPKEEILTKKYGQDFGLVDILISCDRRLGKEKLKEYASKIEEKNPAFKIIQQRIKEQK